MSRKSAIVVEVGLNNASEWAYPEQEISRIKPRKELLEEKGPEIEERKSGTLKNTVW